MADKNTVTGSEECRATTSSAIWGRSSVRLPGNNLCRSASRARRSSRSIREFTP